MTRLSGNIELFDKINENENVIKIREFDPITAEGELRLRLFEVKKRIEKLEKAQQISQEFLESTISV